jgi:UDP-N-acetylmuramoylalanine-D-glutamate ligase
VLELSSYQIDLTQRSIAISVLLNITPDHLDAMRMDDYAASKARLFACSRPTMSRGRTDDDYTRAMRPADRARSGLAAT